MASFVYAVWSITNVASVHCSVRPEISPCTCEPMATANRVELSCEKVDSFHQIVDALSNKFTPNISIDLLISHSQLEDLEMRSFSEMNLNVKKLRMISDNLRSIPELPFRGLSNVEYLGLAENDLEEIPKHALNHLPKISTLDLGKGRIRAVQQDDFKGVPNIQHLILVSNNITRLDKGAFPKRLYTLHLGRNQIDNLNGTLRDLYDLESLFINMNNISSLEDELPASTNLKMILASNNSLEKLPDRMKEYPNLGSLFFQNNKLKSFDGLLKLAKYITVLSASNNRIEYLAEDEFQNAEKMEEIDLAYNNIKYLNKSLLPLKGLQSAYFSHNELQEFSMNEIRGLENLIRLDLSYNQITKLIGRMENVIEPNSFLVELRLQHNKLRSLDGALMGLNKLKFLYLMNNQIERILPDDFIGLESLEILDLSFNQLMTLEETSTTFLPSLKSLKVAYNNLTKLEKDFHGLPVLCTANLTHNHIISISSELVTKTRCRQVPGVPGKLEIWLENNPIMCDEHVIELCPLMEAHEARIRGRSHCTDPPAVEEICTEPPIILKAPLPLIPQIIQTQLHPATNPAIVSQPSIVQVIVPAPLIAPKSLVRNMESGSGAANPLTAIVTTTVPATISSSPSTLNITTAAAASNINSEIVESIILPPSIISSTISPPPLSLLTEVQNSPITTTIRTSTIESSSSSSSQPPPHVEYSTIEYSPLIDDNMSVLSSSSSENDDNSVHEQFSPVVLPGPGSSQLLLPDEPPENP